MRTFYTRRDGDDEDDDERELPHSEQLRPGDLHGATRRSEHTLVQTQRHTQTRARRGNTRMRIPGGLRGGLRVTNLVDERKIHATRTASSYRDVLAHSSPTSHRHRDTLALVGVTGHGAAVVKVIFSAWWEILVHMSFSEWPMRR